MAKTTIPAGGITDGTLTSAKLDQDGAFTFNEDSADVDFRIESNGNANMFTVNAGSNLVGIAADPDLGAGLHIKTGDSGLSAAHTQCDDLVVESDGHTGITITSPAANQCKINFCDTDDDVGSISYNHNGNSMKFRANDLESMEITSAGTVSIPNNDDGGRIDLLGGGADPYMVFRGPGTGTNTKVMFVVNGSEVGTINTTSSGTAYNTSSDYRLKENQVAISDGITRVKQLKPYKFNFKVDPDTKVDGFFAHEVSGIVPEAIAGTKDAVDSDDKPILQGIDQSKIVPLLTAALKESITKIETLETEMTALKARVKTLEDA